MDPVTPPQTEADDIRIMSEGEPEPVEEPSEKPEEKPEEEPEEEEKPSEVEEAEEEEKLKKEIETDEGEEEKIKLDSKVTKPSFSEIQKKYPNIFKDFPDLRDVYHRDAVAFGPTGIFSNVEEAKQASQSQEVLSNINSHLSEGNFSQVMREMDDKTLENFAENVMPALHEINPRLFFKAVHEPVAQMFHSAWAKAEEIDSEAMRNSIKNLCQFVYGKKELPRLRSRELPPEIMEEKKKLQEERQSFHQRNYQNFVGSTNMIIEKKLKEMISNGLDTEGSLSDFTRNAIIETTIKRISEVVRQDEPFKQSLRSMFDRAAKSGRYTSEEKSQIISRYLGRVKNQIGSLRSEIKSQALGRKTRPSNEPRRLKPNKDGETSSRPRGASGINPKNIAWNKTSDMDILNDRITVRK